MSSPRELSPPGRGGISVLSLEGPGALDRARELLPGAALVPGAVALGRLRLPSGSAAGAADEVLACVLGEERVELHVHGSPALVRELTALLGGPLGAAGSRTNAERARAQLPRAAAEAGARILLDQAEGALERELARLAVLPEPEARAGLADLSRRSRSARFAVEPATVVLAGPVNAGKSTLFNALLGARRASVSDEPGTTRDALEEPALLGAWPVRLVDTAGERELGGTAPAEAVERAAQELARERSRGAELVLWLWPPGTAAPARAGGRLLVLPSRGDLAASDPAAGGAEPLRPLEEPEAARAQVLRAFRRALELPEDPWEPGRGVALGAAGRERLEPLPGLAWSGLRRELARWLEEERR